MEKLLKKFGRETKAGPFAMYAPCDIWRVPESLEQAQRLRPHVRYCLDVLSSAGGVDHGLVREGLVGHLSVLAKEGGFRLIEAEYDGRYGCPKGFWYVNLQPFGGVSRKLARGRQRISLARASSIYAWIIGYYSERGDACGSCKTGQHRPYACLGGPTLDRPPLLNTRVPLYGYTALLHPDDVEPVLLLHTIMTLGVISFFFLRRYDVRLYEAVVEELEKWAELLFPEGHDGPVSGTNDGSLTTGNVWDP